MDIREEIKSELDALKVRIKGIDNQQGITNVFLLEIVTDLKLLRVKAEE